MNEAGPPAAPGRHRFLRFLLAGGVNTLFGFAAYSALILAGLPVWAALLLAHIAGVGFNFFTTGRFVFRATLRGRLPRFVAVYALIYGVNLMAIATVHRWVPDEIASQAMLTLPMAGFTFWLMQRFVFDRAATGT